MVTLWEKYVTTCSEESGGQYFARAANHAADAERQVSDGREAVRPAHNEQGGKREPNDAECNYCLKLSPAVKRECQAVCAEKNGGTVTEPCLDLCALVKCTWYKACPESKGAR